MIYTKTPQEIEYMQQAGKVVGTALQMIEKYCTVGVTTLELDTILEEFVLSKGTIPSFKGYHGYKHTSCVSVNSVVVHGVPNQYKLQLGDIVGIDIAVIYNGYHADAARTFPVGKISGQNQRLIDTAKDCFFEGLQFAKQGQRLGDISSAIQKLAEGRGFGVVRDLTGHGIGRALHEDPMLPNFGEAGKGVKLKQGYALAIEPMINAGTPSVVIDNFDKWSCKTKDGLNSAHYENTIIITDGEPLILTL